MNTMEIKAVNEGQVRTSDEWKKLLYPNTQIIDPDGWDRSDFSYSFYQERISIQEFNKRLMSSTVQMNIDHIVPSER
jgi:hypothetical protein